MDLGTTHMARDVSRDIKLKSVDKMNSTIFDSFAKIINKQDAVRREGGLTLLKHLHEHSSDINDNKEYKYAMTRLIRGLGSSKLYAKKGFYSTLTTFLIIHSDVSIDTILTTMDTELHPVNSNAKSEQADVYMGRILTCGALIRSKLLLNSINNTQSKVVEILLNAGKQRSYLSFVSISFLIEFINQLDANSVKKSIWPLIENEFGKPWAEQTLDSFYALLIIRDKFPALVNQDFLQKYLLSNDIITKENINNIVNILTDLPRIKSCHHPVFVLFCEKLAATDLVTDFWLVIDSKFKKPSKTHEYVAIEILKHLLVHLNDKTVLPSLLSSDFLQHMLKKCSILKRNNNDEVVVAFKDLLSLLITSVKDIKTKIQINVLKKLILYPGDLMIEKKTGVKIIQLITSNLNADGVKKLSNIYRTIIENTIPKERERSQTESWTNSERIYAVQLLTRLINHPAILSDPDWKLNQLKFLFLFGFCEVPQVGVELIQHFKDSFYRALDHKMPKLNDLRNMLSELVHYLNTDLSCENIKLRTPLSEESEAAWKKAICLIEKLENNPNAKAIPIFHTMCLHMGLQLFSDPEVAIMSINELQSCYDRVKKKSKSNNNKKLKDEPEWVEVVIDLLLSLLSKNSHLMRSLVTCVFPHICPYIVSMSQILSVLDIKKETNPLSMNGDDNEESSGSDEDDENDEENNVEEHNTEATTDSSDESDMDCDKEDEDEDEDEDETVTDMLRVAVSQALGGTNPDNNDEDMDVDKIDEAEGKRLDESLAAAFKILRQNRRGQSKKQEKSAQTLTHFRARVTDLLEIYLDCNPAMAVVLDMLVPLFALLEFCIKDPHQKPLENRVRACLKKLSSIKKFRDTEGVDNELLTIILKTLIEKGERSASVCQEMGDKLAECCAFLIRCVQYVGLPDNTFVDIYKTNLTAFFKKRDCILPGILFKSLLQQSWEGNWQLAPLLVEYAFDLNTIRSFRRGQALEFLTIFYRNNRLIRSESTKNKNRIKMEKKLCENSINLLQDLCNANESKDEQLTSNENSNVKINQKFVYLFLTLLHTIHGQHLPEIWKWETIGEKLVRYRTKAVLSKDARSAYNRLAQLIGLSTNCPVKKQETDPIPKVNGKISSVKEEDEKEEQKDESVMEINDEENNTEINTAKLKKKKKNKSKQKEKQLLKKESRELRLQTMSEGLDVFQFSSSVNLPNGTNETDSIQNDLVEPAVEANGISKHKRLSTDNLDDFTTPKRKKKSKD
ncbi:PREDICTED: myb-binding protein 1A-like protein [Polistes dominula]|uniref:Myb-binding protein 1A-like protein n=1 Tax=Polistes dominula TaxID=743375 RepID=A0ABM1I1S7_POLDO|nr:PREDICTED: myb-binding protein 1A-like protein [Polistes dominula]